jgi:hypothetical protein
MQSLYPNEAYSLVHVLLPCNWLPAELPYSVELIGLYAAPGVTDESQWVSKPLIFGETSQSYGEASGGYAIVNIANADKVDAEGRELMKVQVGYKVNRNKKCSDSFGFKNLSR